MNRILALILILGLLLPSTVESKHRTHRERNPREVVQVIDNTSAEWAVAVVDTVQDFNAIMPPSGPHLEYVRAEYGCSDVIPICSRPIADALGLAWWSEGKDRFAMIELSESFPLSASGRETVVCHEFMHALAHIDDNYGARPDSCVWGFLPDPGAFDIAYLYDHFKDTMHGKKGCDKPPKKQPNRCDKKRKH